MTHPIHAPAVSLVEQAIALLDQWLRDRLTQEEFAARLRALEVVPLMEQYQEDFKRDASLVYYLDALMLLSSLQHELEFQVAEYGSNVASEDIKCLRELRDKFPEA